MHWQLEPLTNSATARSLEIIARVSLDANDDGCHRIIVSMNQQHFSVAQRSGGKPLS
jgi:hypothetical protein